ncbi:hypothetical protein G3I77_19735 [Streptomyces sp. D2-8]|uniref:hypothetical protein n=1 Tax=Streptomyces sp. D2-8 TaxID=2707767 RepID=UPI0020C0876F|nr:hypothetical protein [Streptomyces sp. D2-8]MCK8435167.1 hypothetical protein [Streptomyces sp. D2-8]
MADEQDSQQDGPSELLDLYRFTAVCLALGIPPHKVAGDFRFGLEGLRQSGVVPLEDLALVHARAAGEVEHPERWAAGFTAGYHSAWAAAVLRVLEARGVEFSKHLHRGLHLCSDADRLTRLLDRAVTATHEADLVAGEPSPRAPDGP